jgi:hypothetical protein
MDDWACPLDERRAAPAASRLDTCGMNRDAAPADAGAQNPYAKVRRWTKIVQGWPKLWANLSGL